MTVEQVILYLYNLLKLVQKDMFQKFFGSSTRKYCIHSSRRLGKTFLLVVIACITAFSKPNAQIRYASVTQKAVKKMVHPIFKEIFKGLPTKFKPVWNGQDGVYRFIQGSECHVAGVNNGHAEDLRGTACDLAIVDEAGFTDELSYLIDSVLMPQLLTTNGKLIMASSSPMSPAHEFVSYIQECRESGSYSSYDIHQGGFAPELVEEFCKEAGGVTSTTWRREYMNEVIVDSNYAIVPEWQKSMVESYQPSSLDQFYHRYVAMDIGTKDFTAILFGVYDFSKATLYIVDEIIIDGPKVTTANISTLVKEKELALKAKPYRRIADNNNLILLQDLSSDFDLHFSPTNKDTLPAMVNELRNWTKSNRIKVSPNCVQTIGCLEFGVWSKDRKDWGRSKQLGHFDALAALMYLVRNVDQNTNPVPANHNTSIFTHYTPPDTRQAEGFKKIFGL